MFRVKKNRRPAFQRGIRTGDDNEFLERATGEMNFFLFFFWSERDKMNGGRSEGVGWE